jgi:hypothetical protein
MLNSQGVTYPFCIALVPIPISSYSRPCRTPMTLTCALDRSNMVLSSHVDAEAGGRPPPAGDERYGGAGNHHAHWLVALWSVDIDSNCSRSRQEKSSWIVHSNYPWISCRKQDEIFADLMKASAISKPNLKKVHDFQFLTFLWIYDVLNGIRL